MSERQSTPMSKIKNGELDQYGAGPLEQQQFGTAGIKRVKFWGCSHSKWSNVTHFRFRLIMQVYIDYHLFSLMFPG